MESVTLAPVGILLLAACLIAMLSRRLGLPYSSGLVAAGLLIAFLPNAPQPPLSRDLIFNILLPPLVFEAALQIDWQRLRRELPVVLLFAFVGVMLAALVVAAGMHALLGWSWIGAGLFAVLIAATDPVAVIAAFKELKAEGRLKLLVESESLINDGVAAVGFVVLAGLAAGGSMSGPAIGLAFLWTLLGGLAVGALASLAVLAIAGRTNDHLVEITLTTLAAYGSFLIAEHVHASGVLASLTAGLLVGNFGWKRAISSGGQTHVLSFWEYIAFLANSFVFLLIGIQLANQPIHQLGLVTSATAILLVLGGRLLAIYPLSLVFLGTDRRLPIGYQHVLFWGGLRGALALALALTIPANVPERSAIIVTAFVVVAFSIFAQGLTMPLLMRWVGGSKKQRKSAVS